MRNLTDKRRRIRVLDENLVNKIAAGEVIERPSSVVKELIENSLDADAHNIEIELEEGGLKLIAVYDDGVGMSSDDLEIAFMRHATSKLSKASDLFNIMSFGFRGEALPSIASVAEVKAVSRPRNRDTGAEIEIEGGKIKGFKAAGCPPGTSIIVANLFFNTPARRKFIKSPRAELARITELVETYAIGNFNVGIKLSHNGREMFNYKSDINLIDRLSQIYGFDNIEKFYPLPGTEEGGFEKPGTVLGYIAHPSFVRARSNGCRFFVNFRPIISRTLLAALRKGYGNKLQPNQYPICAIFLNIPPKNIDVNVHPAKTEIRFKDESALFSSIKHLTEHTLKSAGVITDLSLEDGKREYFASAGSSADYYGNYRPAPSQGNFQEALYRGGFVDLPDSGTDIGENGLGKQGVYLPKEIADPYQPKMWQFMNSFIIVPFSDSLLFIDQHNAHERILYEGAIKRLTSDNRVVQQLLFPITVDLTPSEFAVWNKFRDIFDKLGFEIKEFGGNSVIIYGIPADMDDNAPDLALRRIIDDFQDDDLSGVKENLYKKAAASFACHSAVKAGRELKPEEMSQLCDRLFACEEYNLCPHGRPIIARLTADEIEKKFQRHIPPQN